MSVYFGQAGAYIKIGYSADPIARIGTVTTTVKRPTDLPRGAEVRLIGWIPGDRQVEAAWHRRFASDHVAGEWYYLERPLVEELIWDDPHGIDIRRMSAVAVFASMAHPALTRDELAELGVRIEGQAIEHFGRAS